ncbi:MAG: signal peptidase I [Candidatus Fluviicola riflensis]|nr:MAG: signal peptidase I [Candidatus Fluviicola riflensis]OGS79271.1 MAG: signal peptidase I [Candidatus Fluviicola riflensis]OGS86703.1 MAG: signal peptidase I [Fluviicola sp. RIFCSPHIGHO2_01_FULL_43_53]OGS88823.1 MAG: signal peptidase I [Fluviicola sp. RIFCSPHIGHO2_12_FULL_43_24]
MKIVYLIILLQVFSGCDFINGLSEIKEDFETEKLDSYTMEPLNHYMKKYEIDYKNKVPKRFEVIEFSFEDAYFDTADFYSSNQHVSRVIGLPGEEVELKKGVVYINGKILKEPFLADSIRSNDDFEKMKIEEDNYFVMVDKRKMIFQDTITGVEYKAYDSRIIGTIPGYRIVGTTDLK